MSMILRRKSVIPGFGLTLGLSMLYLSLLVLIPLSSIFLKTATLTWSQFLGHVASPRALAAYQLSFGAAFLGAAINAVFGLLVAWVLVRYEFPGRRIIDGLVDLPFALPTAVAGIALTAVYAENGWLGRPLMALGIKAAFTEIGVVIALTFIGLPFVVRTVQPVLADLEAEIEEAAASLGATRWQTFARVILPTIMPGRGDRVHAGFRASRRRVRVGGFHLGQHAAPHGDCAAHHRHQTGAIRLRRRDRRGDGHASGVIRPAAGTQFPAALEQQVLGGMSGSDAD